MKCFNKARGFTLLEVLVAGFILFMVVSVSSSVFYSSVRSKIAADSYTLSTTYAPMIAEHIILMLEDGANSGDGYWLGVAFSWQATNLSTKPVLGYESNVNEGPVNGSVEGTASLWSVALQIKTGNKTHQYNFTATSWK